MSPLLGLYAGVPVSDLDASIDWYTRFFGRPPDMRAGDEILWDLNDHATLFIEPDAAHAGAGRITFGVSGLDDLLDQLAAAGIEHGAVETYSNGVRHVTVLDPDGNAIAYAEPPDYLGYGGAMEVTEDWSRWWRVTGERELRCILMTAWDPIGVGDEPDAWGQYDRYAHGIASRLHRGGEEAAGAVAEYLDQLEREEMGLGSGGRARANRRLADVLVAWYRWSYERGS